METKIEFSRHNIFISLLAIMFLCFASPAFAATPIAVDDPNEETYEDISIDINVLENDTMGDLPTVIDVVGTPWDGTVTYDDDSIIYQPDPNFYGQDTFNYRIRDNDGETSIAWVTVNVISVNDPPDAVDDSGTVAEAGTLNVSEGDGLLDNDSDPDVGDTLTVNTTPVSLPSHGNLTLNADGSYVYEHDGGESTSDSFEYEVSDGNDGTDTALVTITITPVNDDPVADDDTASVSEGGTLNVAAPGLLANDIDVDGDTLTVNTSPVSGPSHGNLTLYADGSYVYEHDGSETTSDSFMYQVLDGNGGTDTATVDITIMPDNDNPVAVDDTGTVSEGGTLNVAALGLLDNDWDPDVGDTLTVDTTPVSGPSNGTLTLNANGSYEYIHDGTETTSDSFVYRVLDGNGGMDTATVYITITPVNDPPVAVDDPDYSTDEDTSLMVAAPGVLDNDTDADEDTLTAEVQAYPSHGDLYPNPGGGFVYYPDDDFNGTDTFTYFANDGTEYSAEAATVTITVIAVNDDPVASDDDRMVDEGGTLNEEAPGLLINDTDVDGDTLTVNITPVSFPSHGTLTLNADGSYVYEHDGGESTSDSFEYEVLDGNGGTDTATVYISIGMVNDDPVAVDDTGMVDEGDTLNVAAPGLLINDTDVDGDTLTVNTSPESPPSYGTLTLYTDGSYEYIHDGSETISDSFVYRISDGYGGTDTATVTITITPVNDPPDAANDNASVAEGGTLNVAAPGLLANDTDADGDDLTVNTTPATLPSNGTLTLYASGAYDYTHDGGESTSDSFEYEVLDGNGGTDTATVNINIGGMNDDPVAEDDTGTVSEGGTLNVAAPGLLDNDSDVDGDTLTVNITPVSLPSYGILTLHADGAYDYIHDGGESTSDSFIYQILDGQGGTDTATVNISIGLVNDPPIAADDPDYSTEEDAWLIVPEPGVLDNDSDPDGDTLTMEVQTRPSHGNLYENPDGSFIYIPDVDFNGIDTFTSHR
jgi:VCBS repeat-containing protein